MSFINVAIRYSKFSYLLLSSFLFFGCAGQKSATSSNNENQENTSISLEQKRADRVNNAIIESKAPKPITGKQKNNSINK